MTFLNTNVPSDAPLPKNFVFCPRCGKGTKVTPDEGMEDLLWLPPAHWMPHAWRGISFSAVAIWVITFATDQQQRCEIEIDPIVKRAIWVG